MNNAPEVAEFLGKVKALAAVRGLHAVAREQHAPPERVRSQLNAAAPPLRGRASQAVAVASSTGGPAALAALLSSLPRGLEAVVLLVQHIAGGFDQGFAEWLTSLGSMNVRVAKGGESLRAGEAWLAPSGYHMVLSGQGKIVLDDSPPVEFHKPCADLLLKSTASVFGSRCIGVVLSGMGSDGARGAKAIREAGGVAVAQDEASSAIFGMPKAALRLGAVEEMLPIEKMGAWLGERIRRGSRGMEREP